MTVNGGGYFPTRVTETGFKKRFAESEDRSGVGHPSQAVQLVCVRD
jgi:hypothetical protein